MDAVAVGDHLHRLIAKCFGEQATLDCGCASKIAEMNADGSAGVRAKIDEYVDYLAKKADEQSWWKEPLVDLRRRQVRWWKVMCEITKRTGTRNAVLRLLILHACRLAERDAAKYPPVDVVYTLSDESEWNDNELRYSLRSLNKYAINLGKVYVIGHKPPWLTGVEHIPHEDKHAHNKDANLIDKVRAAIAAGCSERFIFASDDQCLLAPVNLSALPAYCGEDLTGKTEWKDGCWWKRLRLTRDYLIANGQTAFNCETHTFQVHSAKLFEKVASTAPYGIEPGFTINTLILNHNPPGTLQPGNGRLYVDTAERTAEDLRKQLAGKLHLGYNDTGLTDTLKAILAERFPLWSRFESDEPVVMDAVAATQYDDPEAADLLRRIYLVGSDSLKTFGGLYEGSYYLQQVPDEAAEFLSLAQRHLSHPRFLEIGSAAGGFARLIDDVMACRSIRVIDDNKHAQAHWRPILLPHCTAEYVGDAGESQPWLQQQNEQYDLIVLDTGEKRHAEIAAQYLAPGGLAVIHNTIYAPAVSGAIVADMRTWSDLDYLGTMGSRLGLSVFRKKGQQQESVYQYPPATLLYHFCPWLGRPQLIEFHLRCLSRYLPQFSKVRINIATGQEFLDPQTIKRRLEPFIHTTDVEFIETPNTNRGEVKPFFDRLLPSVGPDEYVCYGHTKGAMLSGLPGGQAWAELMYALTMSNTRAAIAQMQNMDCIGPFKRIMNHRGSQWHYAGTFFWFRNVQKYAKYSSYCCGRFAVEQWLGRFVPQSRALDIGSWRFLRGVCRNGRGILDAYTRLPFAEIAQ